MFKDLPIKKDFVMGIGQGYSLRYGNWYFQGRTKKEVREKFEAQVHQEATKSDDELEIKVLPNGVVIILKPDESTVFRGSLLDDGTVKIESSASCTDPRAEFNTQVAYWKTQ